VITDHVVTLQPDIASAAVARPALEKVAALETAAIVLAVEAEAPSGRFRLRLWDAYGRNPTDPNANGLPLDFHGSLPRRDIVLAPTDGFDGRTLTWVVRLQSTSPAQYYSVRLSVLQVRGEKKTTSGEFVYSGPLDDVEEITGRFHFKVGS
jgi:hypothetical protein